MAGLILPQLKILLLTPSKCYSSSCYMPVSPQSRLLHQCHNILAQTLQEHNLVTFLVPQLHSNISFLQLKLATASFSLLQSTFLFPHCQCLILFLLHVTALDSTNQHAPFLVVFHTFAHTTFQIEMAKTLSHK